LRKSRENTVGSCARCTSIVSARFWMAVRRYAKIIPWRSRIANFTTGAMNFSRFSAANSFARPISASVEIATSAIGCRA
jgi:hypothetical protein